MMPHKQEMAMDGLGVVVMAAGQSERFVSPHGSVDVFETSEEHDR